LEAFAGSDLGLVVDLGDERADGIHDEAAVGLRGSHDFGRRAMGGKHERGASGHVGQVVDKDHAEVAETVDDQPVVDDLVVAVHRWLEGPHQPGEGFDRHLDAGAKAAWCGEKNQVHSWRVDVRGAHLFEGIGPGAVCTVTDESRRWGGPPEGDR
jgi:hypothetical protein